MKRYGLMAAFLCAATALPARAQDPLTFSVGVDLVQIEVRVTDGDQPVVDLDVEDFVLKEDGQEQDIEVFSFIGPHEPWRPPEVIGSEFGRPNVAARPPLPRDPETYHWLYILPEVRGAVELSRVTDALRTFIKERLPRGFLVSLAGLPFTDDRELLLTTLDRMVGEPSDAIDPLLDLQDNLIFQRAIAAALQRQNGIRTTFVGMSQDPYFSGRGDDFASLVSVERIDRQIIFYGSLALLRYLDLIEKLSAFPGKKMILLYRSGLQIEFAHAELMDEIAAAALRRRVSFFAVDSAGLRANTPVDFEDSQVTFDWDSRRRRSEPDLTSRQLAEVEPKQGLVSLAKTTGGKALINSNDMGSMMQTVLDESSNYYVLGYHPRDLRATGRFRRVEVSVKRPGVKLRAPRGYFEAKPFEQQSKKQKSVALYRALLSGAPSDFRLETSLSFFAAPEGRTATIFSTGVRPREPNPKPSGTSELEATILVRVSNLVFDSMPMFFEQSLKSKRRTGADDPAAAHLVYNARIDLTPGHYSLRMLFRDDRSGEMGALEKPFQVPSLTGRSVPSSLLLTRQMQPRDPASASSGSSREADPQNDLLDVGGMRPTPEPGRTFRQGDVVHGIYHLYNPTSDDLVAAEQGMQMGLLRDGEWLPTGEVAAGGRPFPDQGNHMIRFACWIDTQDLRPGKYTMLGILPNYQIRKVPHVSEEFELLPR